MKEQIDKKMKDIVADDITDINLIQAGYYWNAGYNEFDFTCKIKGEDDVLHMRELELHGNRVPKSVENGINQVTKNVKIHDKYANMC